MNLNLQIVYMLGKCRGRLRYSDIRREGNKVTGDGRRIPVDKEVYNPVLCFLAFASWHVRHST